MRGMRIAIVTRGDLYPTRHGAAVKIVRTAEYLSLQGAEVFVVTDNRDHYLAYRDGQVEEVAYGDRFRASQEWPGFDRGGRFAEKVCDWVGYPADEQRKLLGIYCPSTLFPYAREAISSTVAKGGFPPLVLQPINFEALYAQAAARQETENSGEPN